jgi:hypothetical protein
MTRLPGIDAQISDIVRTQMNSYTQVAKASHKWKLKLPTFKADFALKHIQIKKSEVKYKDYTEVSLLIDISYSTANDTRYIALYKAVLLHYYAKFTPKTRIILYLFGYKVYKKILINSRTDLLTFINTPVKPVIDYAGWNHVLISLDKAITADDVVLITDGTEDSIELPTSNKRWSVISLLANNKLTQLCNNTGGNLIVI